MALIRALSALFFVAFAASLAADDLPAIHDDTTSLLVIRHDVLLKEPLELRSTPATVDFELYPSGLRPVYVDQRFAAFLVRQPREFAVASASFVFRPKRQTGLTDTYRGQRPDERWTIPVAQYDVGRIGLPVEAGTITFAGTLKLQLRRVTDDNQPVRGVTPIIEAGEWLDSDPDDEEDFLDDVIKGTAWQTRRVTRLGSQ